MACQAPLSPSAPLFSQAQFRVGISKDAFRSPEAPASLDFAADEDSPIAVTMSPTLLRRAAWQGLLVPSCPCKPPEMIVVKTEEGDWLECFHCKAKAKPLAGLEGVAKNLDEALRLALTKASS